MSRNQCSVDNHSVRSQVINDNNFIADVRKGGDLLKSFEQSNLVNNMCSFTYKFFKGAESNIFTCKLCLWVIFTILFTTVLFKSRLLCDNSNSLMYEPQKGAKSNTFTCQLCDCTSHADWLCIVIIVTWMYKDLFRFVTNALQWLTRALKRVFPLFRPTVQWTSINRWPREDFFPLSRALGWKFWHLSSFCNTLLQDLTPLHVKISRSMMSVCRRKLKLSTFLHKTVSYNHINFLSTCWQLIWVLTSSGFYSITGRMISKSAGYKIHFQKQSPFRGNFFPLLVWYLLFLWI